MPSEDSTRGERVIRVVLPLPVLAVKKTETHVTAQSRTVKLTPVRAEAKLPHSGRLPSLLLRSLDEPDLRR